MQGHDCGTCRSGTVADWHKQYKKMQNTYLFHGDDSYTSIQKSMFWQKEFEKKFGDLNSQIFEGEELTAAKFSEAVDTLPFLSEKKLIIIRSAFQDTPTDELKKISEKIPEIQDHCVVVFVERKKADLRTSLYKALKKHGQIMDFPIMDKPELATWISNEMQKKGARISQRNTGYLAETVGPNLWQMSHEIEKLTLKAEGSEITEEDIDKLVSPNIETTIFKLTDHLAQKNRRQSIGTLKNLIDSGENLVQTFFMIARHFRILIEIKDCVEKNMNSGSIIKTIKEHPFVVNKGIGQCRNFDTGTLEKIYQKLLQIDIAMKTGKIKMSTDDQSELRLAIEKFIIEFCS